MSTLQKKYPGKLVVLAVNTENNTLEELTRFRDQHQLGQQILMFGNGVANNVYYSPRFPTKYWIDKSGKIVHRHYGGESLDAMEKQLRKMMK